MLGSELPVLPVPARSISRSSCGFNTGFGPGTQATNSCFQIPKFTTGVFPMRFPQIQFVFVIWINTMTLWVALLHYRLVSVVLLAKAICLTGFDGLFLRRRRLRLLSLPALLDSVNIQADLVLVEQKPRRRMLNFQRKQRNYSRSMGTMLMPLVVTTSNPRWGRWRWVVWTKFMKHEWLLLETQLPCSSHMTMSEARAKLKRLSSDNWSMLSQSAKVIRPSTC